MYLFGCRFTLVIDHKPLTTILGPYKGVPSMAAARLQCWAIKLSVYSYDIEFRHTTEHCNADGLSRLPIHSIGSENYISEPALFNLSKLDSLPVTASPLATATHTDKILNKVYRHVINGLPDRVEPDLTPFYHKKDELTVEGRCVLWGMHVVVLQKLKENS